MPVINEATGGAGGGGEKAGVVTNMFYLSVYLFLYLPIFITNLFYCLFIIYLFCEQQAKTLIWTSMLCKVFS